MGDLTRAKLGILFEAHMVEQIAGIIAGAQIYAAPLATLPAGVAMPQGTVSYDNTNRLLKASGWMTDADQAALLTLSNVDEYQKR